MLLVYTIGLRTRIRIVINENFQLFEIVDLYPDHNNIVIYIKKKKFFSKVFQIS